VEESEAGDRRRFAGKIGGHKKPVLSGANADWLRKRVDDRRHPKNTVWKTVSVGSSQTVKSSESLKSLVGAPGLEPGTR
jgi:hypothetical protein